MRKGSGWRIWRSAFGFAWPWGLACGSGRCAPITAAEITARWPGLDDDRGGLWFPDDGCVDLDALTAGFVRVEGMDNVRVIEPGRRFHFPLKSREQLRRFDNVWG